MHRDKDVKIAPPRDRNSIKKDTYLLRKKLLLNNSDYFPIVEFLEWGLPQIDDQFYVEPIPDKLLQGRLAETIPADHVIRVKRSVFDAANNGNGWARMVLAHELGHYFYHDASSVGYAKAMRTEKIPNEINPEWQANVFGAELLAPSDVIKGKRDEEVANQFGISVGAARVQLTYAKANAFGHRQRKRYKKTTKRKLGR